jgi:hypothetical protein
MKVKSNPFQIRHTHALGSAMRIRELMKLAFEVGAEGKAKKDKSKDADPRDSLVKTVDIINDR